MSAAHAGAPSPCTPRLWAATPPAPAPVPIAPPVALALSAGEPGCNGALSFTTTAAGGSGPGYTFAWTLDGRAVARVPAIADATSTLPYTPWPDGRDHVVTSEREAPHHLPTTPPYQVPVGQLTQSALIRTLIKRTASVQLG